MILLLQTFQSINTLANSSKCYACPLLAEMPIL